MVEVSHSRSLSHACSLFGQTIQFWKFGSASDSANQGLAKWVEQWNKENPGKQVQIRFFPFGEYMDGTLLTTAFASGTGPDIFWASPGTFLRYAKGGVLADISDLFTPEAKQDFSPASIEAITVDGKQYAMPFEQEPVALLYNPDLLQKGRSPGSKDVGRAVVRLRKT